MSNYYFLYQESLYRPVKKLRCVFNNVLLMSTKLNWTFPSLHGQNKKWFEAVSDVAQSFISLFWMFWSLFISSIYTALVACPSPHGSKRLRVNYWAPLLERLGVQCLQSSSCSLSRGLNSEPPVDWQSICLSRLPGGHAGEFLMWKKIQFVKWLKSSSRQVFKYVNILCYD